MSAPVFKHFEEIQDGKAKCKHCSSKISGSAKITSNFVTHMKRKHREAYLSTSTTTSTSSSKPEVQSTMTSFAKQTTQCSIHDPRQIQITEKLLFFIAGNLMPLSVVDSKEFRSFVSKLDSRYQIPSRKHLSSKLLQEKATSIQTELKQKLHYAESVCLTLDLWSNRQMKGYFGVTGHFIHDWNLHTVMLTCKRVKRRHTAENIRHEYEEIVASYEISKKSPLL